MRLKQIKILGFKSFADPIELEFNEGIAAIVGPNGCGKSNIADAFRWVLGEQSAKSLRGGKMMDVIFSGTLKQKPLNFAEVTITMTDVECDLPLGYEEVAITRRLHRSGESDYLINNRSVRLKDIQDLFLDSGIGKNAFAIFEQGKIDLVIQHSPLERRYIFEEAAGILRFLSKKREALKRIEQVELNTARLKDIHLEIENQIIQLEKQSEKAKAFKQDKSLLEAFEGALLVKKWDLAENKKNHFLKKEKEILSLIEEEQRAQKTIEEELIELRLKSPQLEGTLKAHAESLYKTISNKTIKEKEKQHHRDRLKEATEKLNKLQEELKCLKAKKETRKLDHESISLKQKALEKDLLEKDVLVKTQKDLAATFESKLKEKGEALQIVQKKLMELIQKENKLESEIKQGIVRQENDQERLLRMESRKKTLNSQIQDLNSGALEKFEAKQKVLDLIDQKKNRLKEQDTLNDHLSVKIQTERRLLETLRQSVQEAKARQKALERMRADLEGFTVGSKKLLQESKNPKSPLYNKIQGLYEYLEPLEGSEKLLALALRPYAQTLVVKERKDLEDVLTYAKEVKLKDFSILCLKDLPSQKQTAKRQKDDKNVPLMASYVNLNDVSSFLIQNLMVATQIDEAYQWVKAKSGEAIVQDGFYLDHKLVLFQANQTESNVFIREAELKSLEEKLLKLEEECKNGEEKLKGLESARASNNQERIELDKVLRANEMSLMELNFFLQRVETDKKKALQEIEQTEKESHLLGVQINNICDALTTLQEKHLEAKTQTQSFQSKSCLLQEEQQSLGTTSKQEIARLKELEMTHYRLRDEQKKHSHALHILEVKDLENAAQEKKIEEEILLIKELKNTLFEQETSVEKSLEEIGAVLIQETKVNKDMEQEASLLKGAIAKVECKITEVQKLLKQKELELNQMRIHLAQIDALQLGHETELFEKFQKSVEEAKKSTPSLEKSVTVIEEQIQALRTSLKNCDDINLAAIDECEKSRVRYDMLSEQIEDLSHSREELVLAIHELDKESRKIFNDTFQQIRLSFQKNFQILFEGGEADLILTETSDILEAGIEIVARPPGKQMRSIQLLSGGEKCLTAMALLFAIFEVRPAPFCVLDEIDAPLDDTNVRRFIQMVKHYIDRCQFIIITHNKQTMSIADVIFGVSMEEKGISKLLSLEFSKTKETPKEAALV